MGNYRFRLSDMIPNAWFYKLKDMGRSRKKYSSSSSSSHPLKRKPTSSVTSNSQKSTSSQRRYSYSITNQPIQRDKFSNSKSLSTQFPEPPRKSYKRRSKRKSMYKPSPKPFSSPPITPDGFGSNEKANSAWNRSSTIPTYSPDYSSSPVESLQSELEEEDHRLVIPGAATWSSSCKCRVSSSTADIIIDMDEEPLGKKPDKVKGFNLASELDLPPILTRPPKPDDKKADRTKQRRVSSNSKLSVKILKEDSVRTRKEQTKTSPAAPRKSLSNSPGIRLRSNSPRIATRKHQPAGTRKSVSSSRNGPVSESFIVVKSSVDPQRDFRDSMVEMIVENNIRASKDLEELLARYLSLNSNEYHDLIVKAFEDIWLDMTRLRL